MTDIQKAFIAYIRELFPATIFDSDDYIWMQGTKGRFLTEAHAFLSGYNAATERAIVKETKP